MEELLKRLCDYLNVVVRTIGCNHTTKLTRDFLEKENVSKDDIDELLHSWMLNGGNCDCEICCNILIPMVYGDI
jgi:hypothetical protein